MVTIYLRYSPGRKRDFEDWTPFDQLKNPVIKGLYKPKPRILCVRDFGTESPLENYCFRLEWLVEYLFGTPSPSRSTVVSEVGESLPVSAALGPGWGWDTWTLEKGKGRRRWDGSEGSGRSRSRPSVLLEGSVWTRFPWHDSRDSEGTYVLILVVCVEVLVSRRMV